MYSEADLRTDVVLLKQSGQKWFWLQRNVVMWTICGFNAAALGAHETSLSETVGNRLWQDLVPSVSQHCQGLQNVDGKVLPWEASIKTCNQLHEVCISVVCLDILHNPLVKGLCLRGGVWGQEEKGGKTRAGSVSMKREERLVGVG